MNNYKYMFCEYLRAQVRAYRKQHKISQENMSEMLHVSPRSYFDQEHGKYGFSALSLISFLILLSEDEVTEFIVQYRKIAEKIDQGILDRENESVA